MGVKNHRLNLQDLFKGRVIYVASPGLPVYKWKVVGFSHEIRTNLNFKQGKATRKLVKCVQFVIDEIHPISVSVNELRAVRYGARMFAKEKQARRFSATLTYPTRKYLFK